MPISTDDLYQKGHYLELNPTWHEQDSDWKAAQVMNLLIRHHIEPDSVCEVGCGAGQVLNRLFELLPEHVEFTGFEIAPAAYKLCASKERKRLRFELTDVLQQPGSYYDVALAMDVFEHVEDCIGFLRAIKSKADYKIFHIPLDISVQGVLTGKLMRRRTTVGHIHYFTKETAIATLEDAGHVILDAVYTSSALDFPPPSLLYAAGRLPLRLALMLNRDLAVRIFGGHSLLVLTR